MNSNTLTALSNWLDGHPPLDEVEFRSIQSCGKDFVMLHTWRDGLTDEQYRALATCCTNGLVQTSTGGSHVEGEAWAGPLKLSITVFEALKLPVGSSYHDPTEVAEVRNAQPRPHH